MKNCGCSIAALLIIVISWGLFFAIAGLEWWIWKDVFVQGFNAPNLTYWQVVGINFLVFVFSAIFNLSIELKGEND